MKPSAKGFSLKNSSGMSADHLADRLQGERALAGHHGRVGQHVVVVGHVEPVEALLRRARACSARSASMAFAFASIACCQRPRRTSMCDGMWTRCPRPGCRSRSASAARVGLLGVGRGLDRVDHQVVGERVLRVEGEDGLEGRDELLRAGLRLAVGRPEVPRAQVGQGLGEEGADVGVLRVGLPDRPHRVGVGLLEGLAVLGLRPGVARGERLDEGSLDGARGGGEGLRLGQGLPRRLRAILGHDGVVDVGAVRDRDAPEGHRALRVELARAAEGADRLVVVEGVQEREALVEVALRLGRDGRDPAGVAPQPLEEGHGPSLAVASAPPETSKRIETTTAARAVATLHLRERRKDLPSRPAGPASFPCWGSDCLSSIPHLRGGSGYASPPVKR